MADYSFGPALDAVGGPNFAFDIINPAPVPSDYFLASILPERLSRFYEAKRGSIRIIPTMAELTGTNSPYRSAGAMQVTQFHEGTAKLTSRLPLHEDTLRELHQALDSIVLRSNRAGTSPDTAVQGRLQGFLIDLAGLILQSHMDSAEYMRSLALTTGELNLTDGQISVAIDYAVPSANKIATASTTENYISGASSTFWADFRAAAKELNWRIRLIVANSTTIYGIADNPANDIELLDQGGGVFRAVRIKGSTERDSRDVRDRVTFVAYNKQGAVINPADLSDPTKVDFMPDGKIVLIGDTPDPGLRIDEGPVTDPALGIELGYTHVAPTTESLGVPGRWGKIYQPEGEEYRVEAKGASNILPVIENPRKLAILTTDMS